MARPAALYAGRPDGRSCQQEEGSMGMENGQPVREERYDLVIVGGGIIGLGAARDAALRGLRVALVEKEDYGWGTSNR